MLPTRMTILLSSIPPKELGEHHSVSYTLWLILARTGWPPPACGNWTGGQYNENPATIQFKFKG
jgi:hypothetical protein